MGVGGVVLLSCQQTQSERRSQEPGKFIHESEVTQERKKVFMKKKKKHFKFLPTEQNYQGSHDGWWWKEISTFGVSLYTVKKLEIIPLKHRVL